MGRSMWPISRIQLLAERDEYLGESGHSLWFRRNLHCAPFETNDILKPLPMDDLKFRAQETTITA